MNANLAIQLRVCAPVSAAQRNLAIQFKVMGAPPSRICHN